MCIRFRSISAFICSLQLTCLKNHLYEWPSFDSFAWILLRIPAAEVVSEVGKASLCDGLGVYIAQEPAIHSVTRQIKTLSENRGSDWNNTFYQELDSLFPTEAAFSIPGTQSSPGNPCGQTTEKAPILSCLGSCTWALGWVLCSGMVSGVHYSRNLFIPPSPIFHYLFFHLSALLWKM